MELMHLDIKNLKATVEDTPILKGVDLTVESGKVHALMGPNGSGKSTLASVLLGHPAYTVTGGSVKFGKADVLKLSPDERSRLGLFLAFQYPQSVAGVTVSSFLRTAVNATRDARGEKPLTVMQFRRKLKEQSELLQVDEAFTERYLNEGFSGGEKKRAEILQMALLEPKIAILDETDSGLDIDALKIVSHGVNALRTSNPGLGVLLITHYQRILNYVKPDVVHVMMHGRIAETGTPELVKKLEDKGYDWLKPGASKKGAKT
jgi:Fe-S cluster assembly ATP-binding protein